MSAEMLTGGVGYVLRKFPVLSETFVLEEILTLEELGLPIHIISLDRSRDPRFHENLPRLKGSVSYVPDITDSKALIRQNRRAAERYGAAYARTLAYVLTRGQPRLLWRFLQAGCVAYEARKLRLRGLHSHFATHPTTVAMLASMIGGFPYSFTAHAYDIYQHSVNRRVLAEKIARARFVVTVSDFNSAHLANLADGAGGKIVRVYNGIDLDRFSPNGAVPPAPFTLLCVGRLVEKKGQLVLVEACPASARPWDLLPVLDRRQGGAARKAVRAHQALGSGEPGPVARSALPTPGVSPLPSLAPVCSAEHRCTRWQS